MNRCLILFSIALLSVSLAVPAADSAPMHLLGFVQQPCEGESNCFSFDVEAVYSGSADEQITFRFNASTTIFDPENYQLTPTQSHIVEGSHLRLLLSPAMNGYVADVIWIGD